MQLTSDIVSPMNELTKLVSLADFDRATLVSPVSDRPGEFAGDLDEGWSSLAGVHGGYMCAVAVRGAEAHAPGRAVRTVATSFLRPGHVGPVEMAVREIRQGRSFTTLDVDLVQDDRLVLTTRVTMMEDRPGVEWGEPVVVDLPPPHRCVPFTPQGEVVHFARLESAFDPNRMPFDPGSGSVSGYVRPLEPRPIDAAWLVMACDWFPPPAFSRTEAPVGGVSIDFTAHIHRQGLILGVGEWLVGTFEVPTSSAGLGVEHGRLTTMDGTVVAESFQTRLTTQG